MERAKRFVVLNRTRGAVLASTCWLRTRLELAGSVDRSKGEIGDRLLALYDYMLGRLTEANIQQEDRPLAEVSRLLTTLQEGWSQRPVVEEGELAIAGR